MFIRKRLLKGRYRIMKKIINKNNATKASVFDMIPEEYRFEGYQRWMV